MTAAGAVAIRRIHFIKQRYRFINEERCQNGSVKLVMDSFVKIIIIHKSTHNICGGVF